MIFRRLHPLLAAAAALASAACRTTTGREDPKPAADAGTGISPTVVGDKGLAASLELTKDEEQAFYLQMLGVELQSGVKVPKDQLHSSRGLLECHTDVVPSTCQLRVRLEGDTLSSSQPIPSPVALKTRAFTLQTRPELAREKVVLADANCNYVGKATPPYTVEDVRCAVTLARATDEAVFDGRLAEELGEDLRGDQPYGTGTVTLSGSLACQWLPGTPRTPCVARALTGGVLQEKLTELSSGGAAEAARKLHQAAFDHASLMGTPPPADATAISGSLVCLVDNTKVESEGRRGYVCRAKL